jgi:hypothetical protein
MEGEKITEPLRDFIAQEIQSVEQLEILLLLAEAPERRWKAREIFDKIRSNEQSVLTRLQRLAARGLLREEPEGFFQFQPSQAGHKELVDELARLYRERRVKITELIYARRADPVQNFADAFKLRKKE